MTDPILSPELLAALVAHVRASAAVRNIERQLNGKTEREWAKRRPEMRTAQSEANAVESAYYRAMSTAIRAEVARLASGEGAGA